MLATLDAAPEIWRVDNLREIGGHRVTLWGQPQVAKEATGPSAVLFDGMKDGLVLPTVPFAGSAQFTIEILFQPLEGGAAQQRFLHAEDAQGARALIETRLDGRGGWWLDTFIVTGDRSSGVTLIDPEHVHRTDAWYWAALRYDGKTMAHFVNGVKELEREAVFKPFGSGRTSLGVRLNQVYWFKGAIREVRFHREAVPDARLQRGP